ncbi:hypothetical protein TIFTF001_042119 [Ficus carica]|uniref:Uncharacterized protein n=1 Tax=Ficus carica TaxID=3494 RepID=A0AA88CTW5_FICCA|nr:hypothetical protein TIFTF001_042119 [Ficus carica]
MMCNSPKYSRRPPSQRRAGRPGRAADQGTLRPRVTGGVIGHPERASGGSSGTEKNRAGCAREAVTLELPAWERSNRRRQLGTTRTIAYRLEVAIASLL